jgi:NADPH2 dehydrogenase
MKMDDPEPQFTQLARNLKEIGLAYLHVVESRISGAETIEARAEQSDFLVDVWDNSGLVILAGGFNPESAHEVTQRYPGKRVAVAFGRHFLANPDLPLRISNNIPLNEYNRTTFYLPKSTVGYIDYPFSKKYLRQEIDVS